jgi:hypothetical protein
MRLALAAVLSLFVASTLTGCGGASIPAPPSDAKPGPPPGTTDAWNKPPEKKK